MLTDEEVKEIELYLLRSCLPESDRKRFQQLLADREKMKKDLETYQQRNSDGKVQFQMLCTLRKTLKEIKHQLAEAREVIEISRCWCPHPHLMGGEPCSKCAYLEKYPKEGK